MDADIDTGIATDTEQYIHFTYKSSHVDVDLDLGVDIDMGI